MPINLYGGMERKMHDFNAYDPIRAVLISLLAILAGGMIRIYILNLQKRRYSPAMLWGAASGITLLLIGIVDQAQRLRGPLTWRLPAYFIAFVFGAISLLKRTRY